METMRHEAMVNTAGEHSASNNEGTRRSYGQLCPVAKALDVLGDRWTLLIIRDLMAGPRRFGQLISGLDGISRNLLTMRLDRLSEDGLIRRSDPPEGQFRAVSHRPYELTEVGETLRPIVAELARWGLGTVDIGLANIDALVHRLDAAVFSFAKPEVLEADPFTIRFDFTIGTVFLNVLASRDEVGAARRSTDRLVPTTLAVLDQNEPQEVQNAFPEFQALLAAEHPADVIVTCDIEALFNYRTGNTATLGSAGTQADSLDNDSSDNNEICVTGPQNLVDQAVEMFGGAVPTLDLSDDVVNVADLLSEIDLLPSDEASNVTLRLVS